MIDKPNNHAGKGTFYIAWTGPAPEGHRTLLPIVPMGLTVAWREIQMLQCGELIIA